MANISGAYDQNAQAQDFTPIPAGVYQAEIIQSDVEEISKNSPKGRCLNLCWKVQGGEYDGRLVWQRLNIWAENMNNLQKVVEIANGDFAAVRAATGRTVVHDSNELHHIPCAITVSIKKDPNGVYDDRNEIKKAAPLQSGSAPAQQPAAPEQTSHPMQSAPAPQQAAPAPQPAAAPQQAAPAATGARPWS